jgi:hypothetical protein
MTPLDYRNATFAELRERLSAQRLAVLQAWRRHGPGTTRDVAAKAGMDILSFRPRSTELFQLGCLVLLVNEERARNEGVYRGLTDFEVWRGFNKHQAEARAAAQPELNLK